MYTLPHTYILCYRTVRLRNTRLYAAPDDQIRRVVLLCNPTFLSLSATYWLIKAQGVYRGQVSGVSNVILLPSLKLCFHFFF